MITADRTIVLIPTYNEVENIGITIDQVFAVDPHLSIMVLDDASPDGTAAAVEAKQKMYPLLRLIRRTKDKGFARSYIDGFMRVRRENMHDLIITMDADFSHEPREIPALISAMNAGADMVVGSRYVAKQRFTGVTLWRRGLSRLANRYVQSILRIPVTDCTSGFIAFRTMLIERLTLDSICTDGYGFLFGLKYQSAHVGARIAEHPVRWPDRHLGASKMTLKRILESTMLPWKIRFERAV